MRNFVFTLSLVFLIIAVTPIPVKAQDYLFSVPQITVDAYWNSDGSLSLDYTFVFQNQTSGHPIEFVDLGLPNSNYDINSITAYVNGNQVNYISSTDFQGEGSDGVAIGTSPYIIAPGTSGTVQVKIGRISSVLRNASQPNNYASAVLRPAYFTSSTASGITDYTITFHLPPGVTSSESVNYSPPQGFSTIPDSGIDSDSRIYFRWHNPTANPYTQYEFGTAFPKSYVPASSIVSFSLSNILRNINLNSLFPYICCTSFIVIIGWGFISSNKKKLQYLPPKVSIEGHGIKRGLTAVEAAIVLEEPLDKIMTMVLFGAIKKNVAEVIVRDPLEIKINEPLPENLNPYELDFLNAFKDDPSTRKKKLNDMMVALVRAVSEKMKGFSRRETVAYYRDITKKAWAQVEAANTPEVMSQKYDEVMEWTMLDRDYDSRTQEVFKNQPIFVPIWWSHFDPQVGRAFASQANPAIPGSTGGIRVPGSEFAASLVTGVQTFSSKVVGNITEFTSKVTSVTNPATNYSSSSGGGYKGKSGGGGCACACACACAGCACACAGGGR